MPIELKVSGDRLLTAEASAFLEALEHRHRDGRHQVLDHRIRRRGEIESGRLPDFLAHTRTIRDRQWQVAAAPADLADRRVEITGPTDAKMVINALNSGAKVFMADFEDANTPTWSNLMEGQANLLAAQRRELSHVAGEKTYRLGENPATLLVRPRGWHLEEKHVLVDGRPMSASLFDFGLYLFWGGRAAIERGSGPYFYLPKIESHLEARLWNEVFRSGQELLGIPPGTIRATVLIETILAAFEMDEILFELREHSSGLNAGRWDYLFSIIKTFKSRPEFVLPDRASVGMTAPFMAAYVDLMVATCHRRGAHAIGGMSAFIPNRRQPEITEAALAKVRADKRREAEAGCDGAWVAHPDLVPVAMAEFDAVLGDAPNQISRLRPEVSVTAEQLLDVRLPDSAVTMSGVRTNVEVGLRYLQAWLGGAGAAAIDNLMEDVATAEISRSQIWQWVRHGVVTAEGEAVTTELVRRLIEETVTGDPGLSAAAALFERIALSPEFVEFLTLPAYQLID